MVVQNWQVCSSTDHTDAFTLEKSLLLPGFHVDSFPFLVVSAKYDQYDKPAKCDSYDLLNVRTAVRSLLIKATANNLALQHQASFFTRYITDKFDFDFCSSKLNEKNKYEYVWHCLSLNADFIKFLKEYGRLPDSNLNRIMDTQKELGEKKQEIKQQREEIKQLMKDNEELNEEQKMTVEKLQQELKI